MLNNTIDLKLKVPLPPCIHEVPEVSDLLTHG